MDQRKYKALRIARGTQEQVAAALRIDQATLSRRESGAARIGAEAAIAMLSLPPQKQPTPKKNAKRIKK